jgi:hypothetical protein
MHPKPKTLLKLVLKLTIFALWKWRGLVFGLGIFENNFRFGAQTFWSLLHHFYTSKSFRWHTNNFLNHSKWTRNEENIEFKNKRVLMFFFPPWMISPFSCFFFWLLFCFWTSKETINLPLMHPWPWKKFKINKKTKEIWEVFGGRVMFGDGPIYPNYT